MSDDERFVQEFESCRWPLTISCHRDHVKLAYHYPRESTFDAAPAKIRDGIRVHNAAHDIPDEPISGRHETTTHAWLQLVAAMLCEYGPAESADAFCDAHPELLGKQTLRLFYSRRRFMSAEAKLTFIEPDVAPLPLTKPTSRRSSRD